MEVIPLLGEHEAPAKDVANEKGSVYTLSDEERKTVKLVNKLFSRAKKHRDKYDVKWMDFYRMFRGKQWKEERPAYRHAAVMNIVWRAIQSQVPIQTDSLPKFEFLPQNPEDREIAEILNQICESDWTKHNWLMQLTETIYDANIYGTGFGAWTWDEKYDYGMGGICHESWDPIHCFPDPDARDVNGKRTGFFIHAEPIAVEKLKSEYPEHAAFIKPDAIDLIEDGDKTDIHKDRYKSPVDNLSIVAGSPEQDDSANPRALKITCWYFDPSIEEVEEEEDHEIEQINPTTGAPEKVMSKRSVFVKKKKYPNGRKIVVVNNIPVEDGPIEYDDGKIPAARLLNYVLPREFWGVGEVEQIEGPQTIYNKLYSYVLDVLTLMGNPIWVISKDSGIDTDNVFNRPGLILEPANAQSIVRREEGVQLQPYVMQILDRVKSEIDDIAGSEDVSRGVKPEGVTAAKAIEALQDTAQTRLRQKARFLDAYLQESGQLYLSRVFQFVTVPRVYRLTNNENSQKYFKFHVEHAQDEMGNPVKIAKVRDYVEQPDGTMAYGEERQYQIQGEFDVKVSTGSALPFAKTEKYTLGFQLFDRQAIDVEELLKVADWPNKEAVLERMRAKEEAMMAAQMAASGGGMPAEAGPVPQDPSLQAV